MFSKEETFELLREERDQNERGLEAEAYGKEGMMHARAQVIEDMRGSLEMEWRLQKMW